MDEYEETNYFEDEYEGKQLISYLKHYFKIFDEVYKPTDEQIEQAFVNVVADMLAELEETTEDN